MFENIIVVCSGNICRSPTGEYLLKSLLPHKNIISAGVIVEQSRLVGKSADFTAANIAKHHHINLDDHKAQQLTEQMCRENDLILVMEQHHLEEVSLISPHSRGKIMRFGHWLGNKEIPDPYKKSVEYYEFVWNLLATSAALWAEKF